MGWNFDLGARKRRPKMSLAAQRRQFRERKLRSGNFCIITTLKCGNDTTVKRGSQMDLRYKSGKCRNYIGSRL